MDAAEVASPSADAKAAAKAERKAAKKKRKRSDAEEVDEAEEAEEASAAPAGEKKHLTKQERKALKLEAKKAGGKAKKVKREPVAAAASGSVAGGDDMDDDDDAATNDGVALGLTAAGAAALEARENKITAKPQVKGAKPLSDFPIGPETVALLNGHGMSTLFPIQAQTFQHIYDGNDMIGRARTGMGKTLAFSLPVIERMVEVRAPAATSRAVPPPAARRCRPPPAHASSSCSRRATRVVSWPGWRALHWARPDRPTRTSPSGAADSAPRGAAVLSRTATPRAGHISLSLS